MQEKCFDCWLLLMLFVKTFFILLLLCCCFVTVVDFKLLPSFFFSFKKSVCYFLWLVGYCYSLFSSSNRLLNDYFWCATVRSLSLEMNVGEKPWCSSKMYIDLFRLSSYLYIVLLLTSIPKHYLHYMYIT